jgi:hypothetical protein
MTNVTSVPVLLQRWLGVTKTEGGVMLVEARFFKDPNPRVMGTLPCHSKKAIDAHFDKMTKKKPFKHGHLIWEDESGDWWAIELWEHKNSTAVLVTQNWDIPKIRAIRWKNPGTCKFETYKVCRSTDILFAGKYRLEIAYIRAMGIIRWIAENVNVGENSPNVPEIVC